MTEHSVDYEAIVVGAGFAGLRMLHDLRELGLSAKVLDGGSDVGGTWYWNRYPGARTDSEAWYYCFSFSKELLADWEWSQRYPSQPEVLSYLRHVADRFDLRKDIQFETWVVSATWDEPTSTWTICTDKGQSLTCRYFISAAGPLSKPYLPDIPGLDRFRGEWYMTARWPKERVDFTGKRVGLIGTGATGVQIGPVVALSAGELTVFQRTANYVLPARNRPLDEPERVAIKADYDAIWARVREQYYAMDLGMTDRSAREMSHEERQAVLERMWEIGGFRYLFQTFNDLWLDAESNEIAAEFIRNKIRAIVKDPVTAELLCPKNHPLASKRPPCGHGYYETFNRNNVTLVDIGDNPIEEITATGLRTATDAHELDMIVFATGFDAITGAATGVDIRGRGGQLLRDNWAEGPRTHLGIGVDGFPNMFTLLGPQGPFANGPTIAENQAEFVVDAVTHMREGGCRVMEPTPAAVESWVQHNEDVVSSSILHKGEEVHSYFLGANIPGKAHAVLAYFGGAGTYFQRLAQEVESGFPGFVLAGSGPVAEPAQQLERESDAQVAA